MVVSRTVQGNADLWLLDGARTSRFTFDAALDQFPLWSPDGTRIVFRSTRMGPGDLYQKLASGAGVEERLVVSDQLKTPTSWSADGRFLLYHSTDPQTSADLWVVPMVGGSDAVGVPEDPLPRESGPCSRRTAGGWPTTRTNRDGTRSTSDPFVSAARRGQPQRRLGAGGRCPRRAAFFPPGGPTATNSTTSTPRAR